MLKTRIITAIIGIPIFLGMLYLGGIYWQGLVIVLAVMSLLEYTAMMRGKGFQPVFLPAGIITLVLLLRVQLGQYTTVLFWAGWLLMIMFAVISHPRCKFIDLALSFFGAFYIGYSLSFALDTPQAGGAFLYLILVLFLTWASDVGGYMFGRLWGKHKMAPRLSPAKTWEGVAGAVFLSALTALGCKYIFAIEYLGIFEVISLGIGASVAAQFGDLIESSVKRYFGVKDSGNIIPGHGGVLDRFDSLMLALPTVYYFLLVFM